MSERRPSRAARPIAALLALLAAAAARGQGASPPPGPVEVEAGAITYDAATDRYVLSEGAVLRRGLVTVKARTASYDPRTGEVDATGGVLLFEPGRVLAASGIHAVLDGPFEAHDIVAFMKDAPLDLSRAPSLDSAERNGRNRLVVGGGEAHGERGAFALERARITLCDCQGAAPSWEIRAHHADVEPGKRAILTWSVIYVTPRFLFIDRPVPVFVLPWFYLPLGQRQAGFLVPEISYTGPTGFALSEPFFIPFGPSWDATVTFDYAFGASASSGRSVEGPGGSLELRWAPAVGASGQLRAFFLHDVGSYTGNAPGGNRIALSVLHDERFDRGDVLRLELALVDDPSYVSDFTRDVLLRGVEYRRSVAAFTAPSDHLLFEAQADYLLPLQYLGQQASPQGLLPYGLFGSDVPSFHRLPSASATLLPVRLGGPLLLSATAGVARFAPIHGPTGDEGASGIGPGERGWPGLGPPNPGQLDGRWEPGERLAANRANVRAEMRAPLAVGRVLSIEPSLAGATAAYAFDAGRAPLVDAWGVAGLAASTQLSRPLGAGRHVLEPRLEWRAGSDVVGPTLPAYAYDEFDFAPTPPGAPPGPQGLALRPLSAAPPGGFHQLRLELRNRITGPAGRLSRDLVELDLGQDVDLAAGGLAETWARLGGGVGPLSMSVLARFYAFGAHSPPGTPAPLYASWLDRFTELRASARVSDRRGDNVSASLLALGSGGSGQLKAGLEPLFDPRPISPALGPDVPLLPLAQGDAGAHAHVFAGLDVDYSVLFTARTVSFGRCGAPGPSAPYILQHVGTVSWDSPCRCWKMAVIVADRDCTGFDFQFLFDLSQLSAGRFQ